MRADHPTVTEGRGAGDCDIGIGRDPNRRPRLLQRFGINADILKLEGRAGETDVVFCPQSLDDLDAFDKTLEALLLGEIKSVQLIVTVAEAGGEERFAVV